MNLLFQLHNLLAHVLQLGDSQFRQLQLLLQRVLLVLQLLVVLHQAYRCRPDGDQVQAGGVPLTRFQSHRYSHISQHRLELVVELGDLRVEGGELGLQVVKASTSLRAAVGDLGAFFLGKFEYSGEGCLLF